MDLKNSNILRVSNSNILITARIPPRPNTSYDYPHGAGCYDFCPPPETSENLEKNKGFAAFEASGLPWELPRRPGAPQEAPQETPGAAKRPKKLKKLIC